jgi:hypothetical protein
MEKYFLSYDLALEIKKLGFDELCLKYWNDFGKTSINRFQLLDNIDDWCYNYNEAPLYLQVIDWFEKEHNIFIGRTCYDDGKTPKRWVYHVDNYYVQEQSYDGAIRYAINKIIIKEK